MFVEAEIGFTKRFYDTTENETAVAQVKITSGVIDIPVTVRYGQYLMLFMHDLYIYDLYHQL